MWVNPKYADQHQAPAPPPETGRPLAVFPRGKDGELRVCLAEFKGNRYVSLRVWERGGDGRMWPVKGKGVSVRLGECDGVAEALGKVTTADWSVPGPEPTASRKPAPPSVAWPAERQGDLLAPWEGEPFDEFN